MLDLKNHTFVLFSTKITSQYQLLLLAPYTNVLKVHRNIRKWWGVLHKAREMYLFPIKGRKSLSDRTLYLISGALIYDSVVLETYVGRKQYSFRIQYYLHVIHINWQSWFLYNPAAFFSQQILKDCT